MRLATARVELLPLLPDFLDELYALETSPDVLHSWRLRGTVPPRRDYEASLWRGVADQRVVLSRSTGALLGLVQLYNVDPWLRHGWVSVIAGARTRGQGTALEGLMVFAEHCFGHWGLQRLLAYSLDTNFAAFRSGPGRNFEHAGVLRDRVLLEGEPHDVHVLWATPETLARQTALVRRAMARAADRAADRAGTDDRGRTVG